ncbi:hypothetical protein V865_005502 [Kwoniella europaea PYCC6329]|uniref:RanBD1 domain-containing protein n=1 Tax=Kwoniella europaea PYCC6329 TaxID=1423913 RepID=A0AAX4KN50_9TREE
MSTKSSPSPSPVKDGADMQRQGSSQSTKDGNSSLKKRVREGSLEPSQAGASIPDPVATKKNRVHSSSSKSAGPNDIAEVEGEDHSSPAQDVDLEAGTSASRNEEKPVGEVRKKVEKMSYEEGKSSDPSKSDKSSTSNEDVEVEGEGKETERLNGDESWEKIEKDEVEGSNGESLKRKALNRSESSYAHEPEDVSTKRAKDVVELPSDKSNKAPSPKKTQKTFSSFASSASPFASLKGSSPTADDSTSTLAAPKPETAKKPQATFGSFSGASSPFASAASPAPTSPTPLSSQTTETETTAPAKKPQATFGAFSSSASPFASTKSTSAFGSAPIKGSAFGTYSSTSSAFSTKKTTPVEGEEKSEAGPSNFGDILKETGGDEETEEKVEMQEQDVSTGEEEEETVFQTRAKLYINDRKTGWKERGVGILRLNVNRSDGSGARLVMRADGVLRLILNSRIYKGITTYPSDKKVNMTLPEDGRMVIACFRMSNTKQVEDFIEAVEQHQPESWVPDTSYTTPA